MYIPGMETDKTHRLVTKLILPQVPSLYQAGLVTKLILPQVMPTSPMLPILIPFAGPYAQPTLLVTSLLLPKYGEKKDLWLM